MSSTERISQVVHYLKGSIRKIDKQEFEEAVRYIKIGIVELEKQTKENENGRSTSD